MTSGYQIIDFKDINLVVGTASTIKGVYSKIEKNYRKPILIVGITIAGVEKASVFKELIPGTNKYTGTLYGYNLEITSADKVTVSVAA